MVVMAMDPHHVPTHDDMQYLWQVLNPEGGAHPAACADVCSPWPLAQTVFAETDGCLCSGTRS